MPKPKPKPHPPVWKYQFEAIGTHWEVEVYQPLGQVAPAALQRAIGQRVETFDRTYSRFRSDSLVHQMSTAAGRYKLPPDASPLVKIYHRLYQLTAGAVTPLVGQLLSDAGYDAEYSLEPGLLSRPPAWEEVLTYEEPYLTLSRPALLDFGAAGKGYLVDLIAEVLDRHGLTAFCVDGGGDMVHRGPADSALRVGLEHPDDPGQVVGVVNLANLSLCGSAGNRRAWAGFHHIMDPQTLASPDHLKAVWVTAPTTLVADALTTALYFTTPDVLAPHFEYDYALIRQDSSVESSAGFPGGFFTAPAEAAV